MGGGELGGRVVGGGALPEVGNHGTWFKTKGKRTVNN